VKLEHETEIKKTASCNNCYIGALAGSSWEICYFGLIVSICNSVQTRLAVIEDVRSLQAGWVSEAFTYKRRIFKMALSYRSKPQ